MSALLPWTEDQEIQICGWCGHEHPISMSCGCIPCSSCGGYHLGHDDEEDR